MAHERRHVDLCSGIGGFALACRWAGVATVAFSEIDAYCCRVLAKHWPDVPNLGDIRNVGRDTIDGDVWLVTAGLPCQPFSSASRGRARGTDDDRWLWPEVARVVSELRPAWFLGENVTHLDRVALDQVVSDLESSGYETASLEVPACAVGCDHRRSRLWIVGYANGNGQPKLSVDAKVARMPERRNQPERVGTENGLSGGIYRYRLRAIGNAIVPQVAYEFIKGMTTCA